MSPLTAAEEALVHGATSTASPHDEKYSQASERIYRVFFDQHDREWGADCEKKTQHPCGVGFNPRFDCPLFPPKKYIVITDTMRGRVHIDYVQWIEDLLTADREYWEEVQFHARKIGGVKAHDLFSIEERHVEPQLLAVVGKPPMPIEVVQAMRAGNPWILGLKLADGAVPPKPAKAPRDWFPDAAQLDSVDPLRLGDPWSEDLPEGAIKGASADAKALEFPHHVAGGRWLLDEHHRALYEQGKAKLFQGTREQAESALANGWQPESTPEVVDPDW